MTVLSGIITHILNGALAFFGRVVGLLPAPIIVFGVWKNRCSSRDNGGANYNLDPQGRPGAFEPFLQKYLHLAEFIIGIATGSIVLLVGSSFLHGKDGRLPSLYTAPLLILGTSVITSILFMISLLLEYEEVQHGNPHTPRHYALIETFGFSALALFVLGYMWLIFAVTA
jgi:hypothetical protein